MEVSVGERALTVARAAAHLCLVPARSQRFGLVPFAIGLAVDGPGLPVGAHRLRQDPPAQSAGAVLSGRRPLRRMVGRGFP